MKTNIESGDPGDPEIAANERESELAALLKLIFRNTTTGFVECLVTETDKRKILQRGYLPLPFYPADLRAEIGESLPPGSVFSFGPAARWRQSPKRGSDADVAEIGCLWAEFSFDNIKGGVLGAVERLGGLTLRPSAVVETPAGKSAIYVLNAPLGYSGLLEWKALNARLNAFAGNKKPPAPSAVISLKLSAGEKGARPQRALISAAESSFTEYSLAEIKEFIDSLALPHSSSYADDESPGIGYAPSESELRARRVPARVAEAIVRGRSLQKGSSGLDEEEAAKNRDALIVRALVEKSFTDSEILSLFKNNPAGCGDFFRKQRAGDRYITALIDAVKTEIRKGASAASGYGLLPSDYTFDENGAVWFESYSERDKSGEPKTVFVSKSPLRITEIRENIDTGQISLVISYEYLEKTRSNVITRAQMCNTRSLVAALSGEGAPVNSNNARHVLSYLAAYEHDFADIIPRKKTTSKFGRAGEGDKFLLPGLMTGVDFEPGNAGDVALYRAFSARRGTLAAWVETMNSIARGGYMIPQIAVAAAFVPPLQKPLQIPNFILDIFGNTSSGKSTTLRLAASVFGSPFDPDSLIHQWMNTKIAVEQIAGMCSELPIFLDDAQHCSNDLKRAVVYMIANGKGKGRAGGHGGLKETMTWRTVALSTSEEPLHESSAHEGVRGRLLPVGGFIAPFPQNSGALVQTLEKAVVVNHGFAGEAFVRHINGWNASDWSKWERRYRLLRQELALNSSSDVVGRVGGYIAAIGVAGEIACPLLGLDFKPDAMVAWLVGHLQEQQSNQNMALQALRLIADYYLSNRAAFAGTGEHRVSRGKGLQGVSKPGEYVGFTRGALDAVFAKRRWNQNAILQKLSEAKALLSTEADRYTKKVTFGGVKHRLVCIKWAALLPDDAGGENV